MPWNGCFRLAWAQHHTLLQPLWSRNHHFFKGVYRNSAEVEQTSTPNWRTSTSDMLKHLAAFGDARWIFSHFFWAESICLTCVSRYERTWKAGGLFWYIAYLFFPHPLANPFHPHLHPCPNIANYTIMPRGWRLSIVRWATVPYMLWPKGFNGNIAWVCWITWLKKR